jgi:mannose-6-phosphate isomerase-like protein (cupin superfamily)
MQSSLTIGRDRIASKLSSEETEGDVAVFEVTIPPGGGPPMLHRHDPFELYRVRRGELTFYLAGADGTVSRAVAGPGSTVPIAGGLEHTIRNESGEDADAVVVFSPGEPMERFFRAAADSAPGDVAALAEANGIVMTRSIDEALAAIPTGYLTLARFDGDGDELLNEYHDNSDVMSGVGRDHGLILHAATKTDEGLLVVNLWPSRAESEAAARDPRRLAVLERAAIEPGRIHREHYAGAHVDLFG